MPEKLIIAIDGPAASGKSTTAQLLARQLGYTYLDTGAMYRACALQAQRKGVDIGDERAVQSLLQDLDIRIEITGETNSIFLGSEDVTAAIRAPEISALASSISALPPVRHKMVELQRKLAASGGVILDGRDIGTYVFPNADLKFFLIASADVRAHRRWLELKSKGIEADHEQVLRDLIQRDKNDSARALAPLSKASDAIEVDTSLMSIAAQVATLHRHVLRHLGIPAVLLAKHSGFCFGVRRAIQLALDANQPGDKVCTLGELIHNPQIVGKLAEQGIRLCGEDVSNSKVIIRSHGASKEVLAKLLSRGNEIIDATCPYVKRAQEMVSSMAGCQVMILGDPGHPEVVGMISYGDKKTRVVQADTDFGTEVWDTLCIVCQTTQKISDLQTLVTRLLPKVKELRVFNTICRATSDRQHSAQALAERSDLMVVVGGKNSANTRMLQQLCQSITHSVHIESETELTPDLLAEHARIGLVAGASSPADTILAVFNTIIKIIGNTEAATHFEEIPLFKEESC